MEFLKIFLALQGALILLMSFIGGVCFAKAITSGKGEVAWRVVHSERSIAGIMPLALVPILPLLALPFWRLHCFTWSFSLGTWILIIGIIAAAITGSRGLGNSNLLLGYNC
ncbi:MAG: hypothetical protein KDD70_17415 [Bdellovibrionales bacterium]|nr:hypothetical protein [Bdellovibrionales bacterium]